MDCEAQGPCATCTAPTSKPVLLQTPNLYCPHTSQALSAYLLGLRTAGLLELDDATDRFLRLMLELSVNHALSNQQQQGGAEQVCVCVCVEGGGGQGKTGGLALSKLQQQQTGMRGGGWGAWKVHGKRTQG